MQFTALPRQTREPPLFCHLSLRSSSWLKLLHAVANSPFRYRRQRAGFYQRGSRGSESVNYDSCWRVDARSCCNATTSNDGSKNVLLLFARAEVEPVWSSSSWGKTSRRRRFCSGVAQSTTTKSTELFSCLCRLGSCENVGFEKDKKKKDKQKKHYSLKD